MPCNKRTDYCDGCYMRRYRKRKTRADKSEVSPPSWGESVKRRKVFSRGVEEESLGSLGSLGSISLRPEEMCETRKFPSVSLYIMRDFMTMPT
jgi:hypothetical protein